MALRGQIINDTQPFYSVRRQNRIVGTHTHIEHTPPLTQVPPLQSTSCDLEADLSSVVVCSSLYVTLRGCAGETNVLKSCVSFY